MREIRFISGDSQSLVLETQDGEKYRLGLDKSVLDAIKREPTAVTAANLSPREIQDAIRSGVSVEELAASSGDSVEYVLKFAIPVLEELSHMLASALAVRVEIEPDRFNEKRFREFGELMNERLANGGAGSVSWSAHRVTPFTWAIGANYSTPGGDGYALWHFDPRALTISPEDESAIALSNAGSFGDAPIPKLKPLPFTPAASPNETATEPDDEKPFELLDAFAARRAAVVETVEIDIVEEIPEEVFDEEPIEEPAFDEPPIQPQDEAPKKGRAPMPSWDEIIFGTKAQDDD